MFDIQNMPPIVHLVAGYTLSLLVDYVLTMRLRRQVARGAQAVQGADADDIRGAFASVVSTLAGAARMHYNLTPRLYVVQRLHTWGAATWLSRFARVAAELPSAPGAQEGSP